MNTKKKVPIGVIALKTTIRFVIVLFVLSLFYVGASAAFVFGKSIFTDESVSSGMGTSHIITIYEDDSINSVANKLYRAGVIVDTNKFFIQAKFYGYKIHAGTYELNTEMNIKEMLIIMSTKMDTAN
jgi:Predicted periplasmic solute-binding protein